ncbi:hypothetical protein ACLKA6_008584 [Drosophila palustris]
MPQLRKSPTTGPPEPATPSPQPTAATPTHITHNPPAKPQPRFRSAIHLTHPSRTAAHHRNSPPRIPPTTRILPVANPYPPAFPVSSALNLNIVHPDNPPRHPRIVYLTPNDGHLADSSPHRNKTRNTPVSLWKRRRDPVAPNLRTANNPPTPVPMLNPDLHAYTSANSTAPQLRHRTHTTTDTSITTDTYIEPEPHVTAPPK